MCLEMSLHVVIARNLLAALAAPLRSLRLPLVGDEVPLEVGGAHLLFADRAKFLCGGYFHAPVKLLLERGGGRRGLLKARGLLMTRGICGGTCRDLKLGS